MAPITWRGRYLGRGGQFVVLLLAVVAVSLFATLSTRELCVCPHQSVPTELGGGPLGDQLKFIALQPGGRLEPITAQHNTDKLLPTTPFSQAEEAFEDLRPENTFQMEDGEDPGMPDIMSNLSLADIKHITWGEGLDAKAFTAWAQSHVTSNISSSFVLPNLLIKAENACQIETELIVLVPSVPEHAFIRELVRQTWAGSMYGMPWPRRRLHLKTSLVFVLGTDGLDEKKISLLKEESDDYGDLVTGSFVDSYRNLTLKMITGLDWVGKFCPSASYILKCDLDTFVNLPLMTRLLKSVGEKLPRFVMGGRHDVLNPPVLRSGRWGISKEAYPFPVFPPYVMGHSYVLTAGLAPQMVRLAHKIPTVPSEDSFITGVMACMLKATRLYHSSFANNFKRPLPCNIVFNEDVSMTKMSMSHLLLMWRHVLTNRCSAREVTPRGNMATEKGKKKQQLAAVNPDQNQKQQPQQDLQEETQEEEWNNPWEINDKDKNINQFQPPQQPRALHGDIPQQVDKLEFNPEVQLQAEDQREANGKLQQHQAHIKQDNWENPWQSQNFGTKVNTLENVGSKPQNSHKAQQNQNNMADRTEQILRHQENEILQQLDQ